jgi:hypothetical protein
MLFINAPLLANLPPLLKIRRGVPVVDGRGEVFSIRILK